MYDFGFIGLGLIGGSLAKALRKKYPDCRINVYSRDPDKLKIIPGDKTADSVSDCLNDLFSGSDIVFLCVPVLAVSDYLEQLKDILPEKCILTDVGSVKSYIHEEVKKAGMSCSFVGGHPMAGSQKSGYENSAAELLEGCVYLLTADDDTDEKKVNVLKKILSDMGCRVYIATPGDHDRAVAGISHVPHIAAAALVRTVKKNDSADKLMEKTASTGFKDTTRIAASSPEVWSQIFLANKENSVLFLDKYINELLEIKKMLQEESKEDIFRLFAESNEYLNELYHSDI